MTTQEMQQRILQAVSSVVSLGLLVCVNGCNAVPSVLNWKTESKLNQKSLAEIWADPELKSTALAYGQSLFAKKRYDNAPIACSDCHGPNGGGTKGTCPQFDRGERLWGSSLEDIFYSIKYGIRDHTIDSTKQPWVIQPKPGTRWSVMPGFKDVLTTPQIKTLSVFVLNLSAGVATKGEGDMLFQRHCSSCHGVHGEGSTRIGAPPLRNKKWWLDFYNQGMEGLQRYISDGPGLNGMRGWGNCLGCLDDAQIKALAVYVRSLGNYPPEDRTQAP
jgi:cytochrome c oxidase cbb3-type subunit 3